MAEAEVRKRTGVIFVAAIVAQVLLVSAQVQTRSGVRVLEAVSFGLPTDESPAAARLAADLGMAHRELVLTDAQSAFTRVADTFNDEIYGLEQREARTR